MADHLSTADHGNPVGNVHDLVQLMGDQQNGGALFLERAQDIEQRVGFLRGQHPGGFVEDQHLRAAIQRLEDFHPLLHADRQGADHGIRVDGEAVALREVEQGFAGAAHGAREHEAALCAENDVFQNGKGFAEHEVLVDHADAGFDRLFRGVEVEWLAEDPHGALVGHVEAVEDRHQRGFARAVLTYDAVDGAALN